MVRHLVASALIVSALGTSPAGAQTPPETPAEALYFLVSRAGTFTVTDGIISLIGTEAATFPVGLATGGFTWVLKPGDIVQTRSSDSFGPMFAHRPLTAGYRRLIAGVSFQHTSFGSIDGQSLSDIRTSGIPTTGDSTALSLAVTVDRVVVGAVYGVTRNVDLGVVVPFGRSSVSGTHSSVFLRAPRPVISADVSSWSLGDVSIVGKLKLPTAPRFELAAGGELRLPTGDKEKLLGTGATQTKVMFIGALNRSVSPHFNVGYVFGGRGFTPLGAGAITLARILEDVQPSPEFDYTVGADVALSPRVTLAGDVVGRSLRKSAQVRFVTTPTYAEFFESAGVMNLMLGAVSAKILVGGSWLLTGSVVFPLNDNGLVPRVSPVVGFERAF